MWEYGMSTEQASKETNQAKTNQRSKTAKLQQPSHDQAPPSGWPRAMAPPFTLSKGQIQEVA